MAGGLRRATEAAKNSVSDPAAVTDAMGKVHGTDNLYVCDASLIPSIPRANTNTPTIMMAERIADAHKAA